MQKGMLSHLQMWRNVWGTIYIGEYGEEDSRLETVKILGPWPQMLLYGLRDLALNALIHLVLIFVPLLNLLLLPLNRRVYCCYDNQVSAVVYAQVNQTLREIAESMMETSGAPEEVIDEVARNWTDSLMVRMGFHNADDAN